MIRPLALALATITGLSAFGCATPSTTPPAPADMTSPLGQFIQARLAESPEPDRIEKLAPLAEAVAKAVKHSEPVDLVFICTHNSRRSHMSQIWAQAGAAHFGLEGVRTFSGGTEATAFNPRAVAALQRAGFTVEKREEASNPVYEVTGMEGVELECFSKRFEDTPNPDQGFAAVMTCTDADEACPYVPGAAMRFSVPFVDPKVSDGTPEEAATYDERCAQIAREMLWVMQTAAAMD